MTRGEDGIRGGDIRAGQGVVFLHVAAGMERQRNPLKRQENEGQGAMSPCQSLYLVVVHMVRWRGCRYCAGISGTSARDQN